MTERRNTPTDDDRVRVALRELADEALHEPTRTIEPNAAGRRTFEVGWRRGLMAAAVVALLAAAVTLVVRRSTDNVATDETTSTTAPTEASTGSWFVDLEPDSVAPLPDAPIAGRIGPAAVWTGTEMIVWGGAELAEDGAVPRSDGAAFDPVTGEWRVLPAAPIEGRSYATTVWTGTEMIVVGGSRNAVGLNDGAAYDPATNEWRTLPASPLRSVIMPAVAWTGKEMIVVGGLDIGNAAAAYSPSNDSWRELPFAPGRVTATAQATWTGEAMLTTVFAGEADEHVQLVMYRPDVDEWEVVQDEFPSELLVGVPGVDLGMVGEEVVALTFSPEFGIPVLSPFGDIGGELQPKPADLAPVSAWQPVWSGHEILLWSGGDRGVAFDPLADEWREFPAGDVASRTDGAVVWADGVMLAWGGLVLNEDAPLNAIGIADGIIYRPVDPPEPATPTTAATTTTPPTTTDGATTESSLTATQFTHKGSAAEVCNAAVIEAGEANAESIDAVILHDETVDVDGSPTRWLVCTGGPATAWGNTVLVSTDSGEWRFSALGFGGMVHAGDETTVEIDGASATVRWTSMVQARSAVATTHDAGATWTIVETDHG